MKPGDKREIEGKIYIAKNSVESESCNDCEFHKNDDCYLNCNSIANECGENDIIYKLDTESSFSEDDVKERVVSKLLEKGFSGFADHTALPNMLSEIVIDILNEQKQ